MVPALNDCPKLCHLAAKSPKALSTVYLALESLYLKFFFVSSKDIGNGCWSKLRKRKVLSPSRKLEPSPIPIPGISMGEGILNALPGKLAIYFLFPLHQLDVVNSKSFQNR